MKIVNGIKIDANGGEIKTMKEIEYEDIKLGDIIAYKDYDYGDTDQFGKVKEILFILKSEDRVGRLYKVKKINGYDNVSLEEVKESNIVDVYNRLKIDESK